MDTWSLEAVTLITLVESIYDMSVCVTGINNHGKLMLV